jgi:hypothetical protein
MPDWLNSLGGGEEKPASVEPVSFVESNVPESEAQFLPPMDMPDWLKNPSEIKEEKPSQDTTTPLWLKPEVKNAEPEVPAWLASEETVRLSEPSFEETSVQNDSFGDLPDWLKAESTETKSFETPEIDELKPQVKESASDDFFKTIQLQSEPVEKNIFEEIPAFTPEPQTGNMEGLFTDMPDWLSNESPASSTDLQTPTLNDDELQSGNLPSWVEAMRPSDSGFSRGVTSASDQTLESRGALAGLQGVLPAIAGFAPTSKPKAYSLKLNVDDEQLRHAGILEEILAAETAPVPLESFSTLRTSRSLRWALAILMLTAVFGTIFLRTQIFSLPRGVPNEVSAAIQISQSFPENARLLVAVDYEASHVGEMEAAAAPLFDNLLLLKHPHLTFISTNETGSTLAEHFLTGVLGSHNYQSGVSYANLGYLPGGQMGIHMFAQNPNISAPLDVTGQPAWASAPLEDIVTLNQFNCMILITDNADAARVWVEQTEGLRGDMPFIVISSAHAAAMIQPYYESGQVKGMVPGLYGGAIFEQYNAGRPGVARNYWDAYSIGMLMAMSLVLCGGLWNLVVGLRERAALREAK